MGGILLLCGFLACGLAAADALFRRHSGLIRVWLGLVLGMMLMMWLPVPFAFWMTFNQTAQLCGLGVAALFAGEITGVLVGGVLGALPGAFDVSAALVAQAGVAVLYA